MELADDSDIHELASREHVNANQIIEVLELELRKNKQTIEEVDSFYKEATKQQEYVQNQLFHAKQVNENFSELEMHQNHFTSWKEQAKEMDRLKSEVSAAEQAKLIIPYEHQLKEASKEFEEGDKALQQLEAQQTKMENQKQQAEVDFKKEQENAGERDKISIEVNRLEGFLPVVKELEEKNGDSETRCPIKAGRITVR